jgi:mannan endo-1,6-alpha-mannosidase
MWQSRVEGILNASSVFFTNNVMYEVACESNGKCDNDQKTFKAYFSRWMAATTKIAPYTASTIMNLLATSATACAKTCTAGEDGNQCGLQWKMEANDGSLGPGEQMAAVQVFSGLLAGEVAGALTNQTGGTSEGDSTAGTTANDNPLKYSTITTGEKAGAAILTLTVLIGLFSGVLWMAIDSE